MLEREFGVVPTLLPVGTSESTNEVPLDASLALFSTMLPGCWFVETGNWDSIKLVGLNEERLWAFLLLFVIGLSSEVNVLPFSPASLERWSSKLLSWRFVSYISVERLSQSYVPTLVFLFRAGLPTGEAAKSNSSSSSMRRLLRLLLVTCFRGSIFS